LQQPGAALGAMAALEVPFVDAEDAETLGYFWKTLGATRFTDGGAPAPGYACTVVVADRFGVVAFSDMQGEFVGRAWQHTPTDAADNDL